ncbi:sigma-54 dependent transcriptional regulator [Xanthobacter agilis]|uniref:DNA-binding NtrC family response regulator n=2 Tax=Xanthobacter agilis TaxID=47492 RepID=A0ABU0L9M9_XANAG|nr:sigma-54 dependent transcriptional regulator [Xanthobacter agilis]MDQ0503842.1 DNA-binding NtrC family response regulator [Xanthobacter agilis]
MTMTSLAPAEPATDLTFSPHLAESSVLVVDDEPGMRNFLTRMLETRCRHVAEAADVASAARLLEATPFDLIILDNIMAGRTGLDWLKELRATGFYREVILITAFADLETAIEALRAGAADFVLKPFRSNQILNAIARCLERGRLSRENFVLKRALGTLPLAPSGPSTLVGESLSIHAVRAMVARVAPMPTTVLVTGESGTGKEVTARALHTASSRAAKPFVPVNCAAIAPEIIESELFGHLKGAFTGAASSREGLFFYAQGGTLFLDEVGELPLGLQAKLLRVIEDKKVRPVGAEREVPVDVRLVAATNCDLKEMVACGRFRQDLYYRLNVVNIDLAPLRERAADVAPLARLFMAELSAQLGVPPLELTPAVLRELARYPWPGNVRELRNVIERALILGDFPRDVVPAEDGEGEEAHSQALEAVEKHHMLKVLAEAGGNRAEAARRLGVSRKTLDRKLKAWHG